jgi:hypothetical protein
MEYRGIITDPLTQAGSMSFYLCATGLHAGTDIIPA